MIKMECIDDDNDNECNDDWVYWCDSDNECNDNDDECNVM